MADPNNSASLQPSYSYPPPHLVHYTTRPMKRRGSDPQFIPAEATFNPRPYHPVSSQQSQPRQHSQAPTSSASSSRPNTSRNRGNLNLDPTPDDSDALFIHPPFDDFPNADSYKDGLTYNIMADHLDWFLDANDFIHPDNHNERAIGYPSKLEPPRGWCPQRKSKEGWPEGEEPRLRCTFCRRSYSGTNAKSMWRRHVLEKHKIAMANRRENTTGRGGRAANKENRTASGSDSRRTDEGSTQPASTTEASTSAHALDSSDDEAEQPAHLPPRSDEPDVFGAINTSSTPPLTPGGPSPSRSTHRNNGGFDSPYDPLATPAFRHSPRVSRQPWRFPSPSHPLYASKDKELPLAMLVRGFTSPMVHGSDNSPFFPMPGSEHKKRSVFSSPFVSKDTDRISFLDESPALVFDGTPLSARLTRSPFEARSADSPLGQSQRGSLRVSSWTEATKKWQAEAAAGSPRKTTAEGSGLLAPIELQGDDVFTDGMYSSFIDFNPKGEGSTRSPSRATVAESPVVRTQPQTSLSAVTKGSSGLMSFGSGLMDAFLSGKTKVKARRAESSDEDSDSDMSGPSHGSPIRVGKKTRRALSSTWSKDDDGDTEMTDHHPKKRRRTFSGRD